MQTWSLRSSVFNGQHFQSAVLIGVNADIAGNFERLLGDFVGAELGVFQQRPGGGLGKRPAGADSDQPPLLRLDYVAVAGNDQGGGFVRNGQQGFQFAQGSVRAPVFGQFNSGTGEIA